MAKISVYNATQYTLTLEATWKDGRDTKSIEAFEDASIDNWTRELKYKVTAKNAKGEEVPVSHNTGTIEWERSYSFFAYHKIAPNKPLYLSGRHTLWDSTPPEMRDSAKAVVKNATKLKGQRATLPQIDDEQVAIIDRIEDIERQSELVE